MNAIDYAKQVTELFAVPKTAMRVKKLIEDEHSDADSIASLVKTDPGLSVHILKIANSAIYRFPRKIETLQRAIQVIGTSAVYDYALVFGMTNAFGNDQKEFVDLDKFWEQSVCCALLAKHFASLNGMKDADRVFVSGLLHNVGELVMLKVNPGLAKDCSLFDTKLSPKECQYDILGFTYAEISAALSQQWLLPDSIVSTIAMQHHDDKASDSMEVQIIQLAYSLSIVNTYGHHYNVAEHISPFLYESLNISLDEVEEALDSTNYQVEQVIHLFNPDVFKVA
ncbi:HDOD domain-containing protein [Glaciecola sp. MH2013]|uniref:HDOD domain-containing protein n=1 Tax=Glaciecola sp. MH2013 TaxID=2785524 RepID=UPI00189D1959|nr:HDOD domain-containing protein [Glaciecola sp. MH2013]MBF7072954.1 HDOD domain-containing protein [Glaciecola sp. MH2013]